MEKMKYQLTLIEWLDSYGVSPQWEEIANITEPKPMSVYSVGWVVAETDSALTIVPHIHGSNEKIGAIESGCGDMTIPAVCVVKRQVLVPKLIDGE